MRCTRAKHCLWKRTVFICLFYCDEGNSSAAMITVANVNKSLASCLRYVYQFTLQVDLSFYQSIRCKVFRIECEALQLYQCERNAAEGFIFVANETSKKHHSEDKEYNVDWNCEGWRKEYRLAFAHHMRYLKHRWWKKNEVEICMQVAHRLNYIANPNMEFSGVFDIDWTMYWVYICQTLECRMKGQFYDFRMKWHVRCNVHTKLK